MASGTTPRAVTRRELSALLRAHADHLIWRVGLGPVAMGQSIDDPPTLIVHVTEEQRQSMPTSITATLDAEYVLVPLRARVHTSPPTPQKA